MTALSKANTLAVLGLCLFLVSTFLPLYYFSGQRIGYEYLAFCITSLTDGFAITWHALFFISTYFVMIILPVLLVTKYTRESVPNSLILTQILLLAHLLLFPVAAPISVFRSGYYLMVVSMVLVLGASFMSRRNKPYQETKDRYGKYGRLLTKP